MLRIDKQVVITIDGEDLKTLGNVCELARQKMPTGCAIAEGFTGAETRQMRDFLEAVFTA